MKSAAGAISTRARTRSGRAMAARQASQPPMDEPTSTTGPSTKASSTARTSERQRVITPSSNAPSEAPWPK